MDREGGEEGQEI